MTEYLENTVDKFIFRVATDRAYSREGVWAIDAGVAGQVRIGLSDFAQQRNGDATFVHLKPSGTRLAEGDEFGELETVKANLSLIAPLAGRIVEINGDLEANPENINQDPYGKGWLAVVEAADWQAARARLLEPAAYLEVVRAEAEEESS